MCFDYSTEAWLLRGECGTATSLSPRHTNPCYFIDRQMLWHERRPVWYRAGRVVPELCTPNLCLGARTGALASAFANERKSMLLPSQTVVLPSGEVIKTRQRARKSAAGWDTTKLCVQPFHAFPRLR
jgi:hypothetical protein